jgi:hypothetical protein
MLMAMLGFRQRRSCLQKNRTISAKHCRANTSTPGMTRLYRWPSTPEKHRQSHATCDQKTTGYHFDNAVGSTLRYNSFHGAQVFWQGYLHWNRWWLLLRLRDNRSGLLGWPSQWSLRHQLRLIRDRHPSRAPHAASLPPGIRRQALQACTALRTAKANQLIRTAHSTPLFVK